MRFFFFFLNITSSPGPVRAARLAGQPAHVPQLWGDSIWGQKALLVTDTDTPWWMVAKMASCTQDGRQGTHSLTGSHSRCWGKGHQEVETHMFCLVNRSTGPQIPPLPLPLSTLLSTSSRKARKKSCVRLCLCFCLGWGRNPRPGVNLLGTTLGKKLEVKRYLSILPLLLCVLPNSGLSQAAEGKINLPKPLGPQPAPGTRTPL